MSICVAGLLSTVDDKTGAPKWKLEESLIGTNPGLGIRPISEETERGSVIQFNKKKDAEINYWVNMIDAFLDGKYQMSKFMIMYNKYI